MANRIACSPLTGRIHAGRVSQDGTYFVGQKRDVTSDVLCALIQKAEFHGGSFEIESAGKRWAVTVKATGQEGGAAPAQPQRIPCTCGDEYQAGTPGAAEIQSTGKFPGCNAEADAAGQEGEGPTYRDELRAEWEAEMRADAFGMRGGAA